MKEPENILKIFREVLKAVEKKDVVRLKELSNQTIHSASTSQDPDNIAVAVVIYSLGKVIERAGKREDYKTITPLIKSATQALENKEEEKFRNLLRRIRNEIEKSFGKLKGYIQDVFRKASINKASKIHEHGISLEKTAKLLGITMFELANYAGQTAMSEVPETKTLGVKSRIKLVEELFG